MISKEQFDNFIQLQNASFDLNAKNSGFSFKELGEYFDYYNKNNIKIGRYWKIQFGLLTEINGQFKIQSKKVYFAFLMPGGQIEEFDRYIGEGQSTFSSAKGWITRKHGGIKPIRGVWGKSQEDCLYLLFHGD